MTSGGRRTWYRYHPLLREMLLHQLRSEDPTGLREAHRAAARWFAQDGQALRALEHAADAEDWPLLGEVFVEGRPRSSRAAPRERRPGPAARAVRDPATRRPPAPVRGLARVRRRALRRRAASRRAGARPPGPAADPVADPAGAVLLELLAASVARSTGDVRGLATAAGGALAAADAVPYPFPALETYRGLARAHRAAGLAWCAISPDPEGEPVPGTLTAPGARAWRAPQLYALGARAAAALRAVAAGRLDAETPRAPPCWSRPSGAAGTGTRTCVLRTRRARGCATSGVGRRARPPPRARARGGRRWSRARVRGRRPAAPGARRRGPWARAGRAAGARRRGPRPGAVRDAPVLADLWVRATAAARRVDDGTGPALGARVGRNGWGAPRWSRCAARASSWPRGAPGRPSAPWRVWGHAGEEADVVVRVEGALVLASALARAGTRRVDARSGAH